MNEKPDRLWALQFAVFVVVIVLCLIWVKRHAAEYDNPAPFEQGAEEVEESR